jgi:hypothetical protein
MVDQVDQREGAALSGHDIPGAPATAPGGMEPPDTVGARRRANTGAARGQNAPKAPDVSEAAGWAAERPPADVWHVEGASCVEQRGPARASAPTRPVTSSGETLQDAWLRVRTRQQLREFLRAVPRREAAATLTLARPDGSTRLFTRGELSAAIDHLRPRQRQIIRLAIEDRWPRQRVCEYLRHISIKTFERDQVEALDRLAAL